LHSRWGVSFQDYLPKVGGTVVCNILIETKAAIDNIEAICAVEGISVLVLAPFDLSVELGCPHQFDNPIFLKAEANIRAATRCGAKTSAGGICKCPAISGRMRCRLHGGRSTGAPKGSANGNFTAGEFTAEAIEERQWLRSVVRAYGKLGSSS
jgi:2-keto-3-deoxy-L-rhamnonate aldolase RhmA